MQRNDWRRREGNRNIVIMGYFVYILTCSDNSLYTGITNNIERRLEEHNKGEGAKYTRGRIPVALSYLESFEDKSGALKKEAQLKRLSRKAKLQLIEAYIEGIKE